jgi:hypothetical protein
VTPEEASQIVANYHGAVRSGAYLDWSLEQLLGVHKQLREARLGLASYGDHQAKCEASLEKLIERISMKQLEEHAERHHGEVMKVGIKTHRATEKILRWTKLGVAIAFAALVLGLIQDTPLSRLLRTMSARLRQPSLAKIEPSPHARETVTPASESPTASPTPLAEESPQ